MRCTQISAISDGLRIACPCGIHIRPRKLQAFMRHYNTKQHQRFIAKHPTVAVPTPKNWMSWRGKGWRVYEPILNGDKMRCPCGHFVQASRHGLKTHYATKAHCDFAKANPGVTMPTWNWVLEQRCKQTWVVNTWKALCKKLCKTFKNSAISVQNSAISAKVFKVRETSHNTLWACHTLAKTK